MSQLALCAAVAQFNADVVHDRLRPGEMLTGGELERTVTPVPVFGDHLVNVDSQRPATLFAPGDELARRRQEWALLAAGNAHTGIYLRH